MPWRFTSYDKIPGSSQRWDASPADIRRLERVDWVVTEKVHGANFCFVLSSGTIDCAKRKAMLSPTEDFFGHGRVLERLRGTLRQLYVEHRGTAARLLVYGELFGGGYPHPDVAPVAGVQPVQTGVWYTPDVDFVAFDVVEEGADGQRRYWSHERLQASLAAAGVPVLSPLFVGSYAEARAQPVDFQTTLPALRGLPPLLDNFAEGIVLKPCEPVVVGGLRPTLKCKPARFAEDARYHQAQRWAPAPIAADPLDTLEYALMSRLTPPRCAAARSKLGPSASVGALVAEVCADVWADVREANGALLGGLGPEDRLLLEETLQQEAAVAVREILSTL